MPVNSYHYLSLEERKIIFKNTYKEKLREARLKYPDLYIWPIEKLDLVFSRMSDALDRGTYNKDSHAFKATCKKLGLKHTYKEINSYLHDENFGNQNRVTT